jgi:vacuolar-type H+-ATPase subunit D/Vma8
LTATRDRTRLRTPREIESQVRDIKATLDKLIDATYGYREAHDYVSDRRASQTDENKRMRISGSHVSDPTLETVVSQETNKGRPAQAGASLDSAANDMRSALARVRRVFDGPNDYYEPLESYRP